MHLHILSTFDPLSDRIDKKILWYLSADERVFSLHTSLVVMSV